MNALSRFAAAVTLLFAVAVPASSQTYPVASVQHQQPSLEKGFSAGKLFQFGNLDSVNLFNGNLNLAIPLGQTYRVGGNLSYGFTLVYSGNNWDFEYNDTWSLINSPATDPTYGFQPENWSIPYEHANAGLGWTVSLGRMFHPHGQLEWVYESPDGGTHSFYADLHGGGAPLQNAPETSYTRDNTYIRRTVAANGTQTLEFPNGNTHVFDSQGRLTSMSDRFSHTVTVTYDGVGVPAPQTSACGEPADITERWTVTDSTTRKHYLYFRAEPSYAAVLCEADLAAFAPAVQSTYSFAYATRKLSRQYIDTVVTPHVGPTAEVGLLTDLNLPDGTKYSFVYDIGTRNGVAVSSDDSDATKVPNEYSYLALAAPGSFSGHLTSMVLPTLGKIDWTYKSYFFPPIIAGREGDPPYGERGTRTSSVGVRTRTETYTVDGTAQSHSTLYASAALRDNYGHITSTTTVTDALNGKTVNYFSACRDCTGIDPAANPYGGSHDIEYGLPVMHGAPRPEDGPSEVDGMFLSVRAYDASGLLLSSTYRSYDFDYDGDPDQPYDFNRRAKGEITIEREPAPGSNNTTGPELKRTIKYSDFDGLGHYRTAFTSDYNTAVAGRTVTQTFNRAEADVDSSAFDSGTWPNVAMPALSAPWILGRYASVTESRTDFPAVKTLFYHRPDGFLAKTRVLANGSSAGPTDLLARYSDGASPTGDVTAEEYFGGDGANLATSPLSSMAPTTPTYRIDHTYSAGSLASSKYAGASFYSVRNDIDVATGLVKKSYDSSDVSTEYVYDVMGRPTTVTPTGAVPTTYAYQAASATAAAAVTVKSISPSAGTVESLTQFDPMGRVWREWTRLPDASRWAVRQTAYDALGRVASVSQPEESTSTSNDPSAPHVTTSTYDARGRAVTITAPDASTVSTTFGIASNLRTVTRAVRNGDGTQAPSGGNTTERYDGAGRLVSVSEQSGGADATYSYDDTAGHLTKVSLVPAGTSGGTAQTREFTYDLRGFLTSEKPAELGGIAITYGGYDARGHAGTKTLGTADPTEYDQKFVYDFAERATTISARNANSPGTYRPWKEFTFGTAGSANGKLLTALRHNHHPSLADMTVKETYEYGDTAARLTKKTTAIARVSGGSSTPVQTLEQSYSYNDLGQLASLTYPQCTQSSGCGAATWNALTRTYSNGALASIPGFASGLTYGASGIVTGIVHSNGVADTIAEDANGMGRPKTIQFGQFIGCTPVAIGTQPQNQTIVAGTSATLSVASLAGYPLVRFQWYSQGLAIPGATGSTYQTPQLTQNTSYMVVVFNDCSRVESSTALVSICTPPSITTQPASTIIASGQQATLTTAATGDSPSYQWYRGSGTANPVGSGSSYTTPALTSTTSYWVRISNACGTVDSAFATVTVPLAAPTGVTATKSGAAVSVTWIASSGADHYEVWRRDASGSTYVKLGESASTAYGDSAVASNFAYAYKIRAVDAVGGSASTLSVGDVATMMTFSPISTSTIIAASHFDELLSLVNCVRAAGGFGPTTWAAILPAGVPSPAAGAAIRRDHLASVRQAVNDARTALALPTWSFTDPTITTTTSVKLVHITDVRGAAQ